MTVRVRFLTTFSYSLRDKERLGDFISKPQPGDQSPDLIFASRRF